MYMCAAREASAGLVADDLAASAGPRRLFHGLSLRVGAGEALAVVGASGAGKSTLLRCLARLQEPEHGRVTLDGRSAESFGLPTYRRRVVYVAQRAVMQAGTIEENLAFAFRFASATSAYPREEAARLLDALGLAVDPATVAARCSEGERQRVALIRALLLQPQILLLDEPTSGLDGATVTRVEAELRARQSGGMGLVLVSHDPLQVSRVATRTLSLGVHDA